MRTGQGTGGGGEKVHKRGRGGDSRNRCKYSILYTNARSILNKLDELKATVSLLQPDIICICESFTKADIKDALLNIDEYQIIVRKDGKDTIEGKCRGLLIYCKNNLRADKLNNKDFDEVTEMAGISLPWGEGRHLSLVLVYRPPVDPGSRADNGNTEQLCAALRGLNSGPTVCVGDFNFHIDWEHGYSPRKCETIFLDCVQDMFWEQLVDFSTHQKNGRPDLVLASSQELVSGVKSEGYLGKADHQMLTVDLVGPPKNNDSIEMIQDWSRADMDKLKEKLRNTDWNIVGEGKSGTEEWESFKEILEKAVEECVPMKKRRRGNRPLWMTKNVMRLIRKKRRMWKHYSSSPTTKSDYSQFEAYKAVQKEVRNAVKNAKKNFEKKLAKDAKKKPKQFYSYIKKRNSNRVCVGPLKDDKNNLVTEDKEMTEILNSWYSSVFTREDCTNIPQAEQLHPSQESLTDIEMTLTSVRKKLQNLKTSSAPGPDKISPRVLHDMANILSIPLTSIFNKCMSEGSVPGDWKLANITPIFKSKSKSVAANNRPVALTSVVCKVMESLVRDAIVEHLAQHQLIRSSQHGFMAGRSCLTNLLEYKEELNKLIDEGKAVDLIYLDFSKAFDLVGHQRLLATVEGLGIRGKVLTWLGEWLSNRKQRVVLNGEASDWRKVVSGVVQGSVLGPVLFLCFINSLDMAVEKVMEMSRLAMDRESEDNMNDNSVFKKFADDTKWGMVVKKEEDREKFQQGLDNLDKWAEEWQMAYNIGKCHILHLGKNNPNYLYTLGGQELEVTKCEKDLGVMISDDLKPSLQCAKAATKANQVLGQLARSVTYRDARTFMRLYTVYVRCHLEYAVAAWAPWTKADMEVLERVQRRAVAMVSNLKQKDYVSRLKELNTEHGQKITTLEERRMRGDLIQMYRIVTGKDKVDPSTWFTMSAVREDVVNTRGATGYLNVAHPPVCRTELRRHQFSYRVVEPWNKLPDSVKMAESVNGFKTALDRHTGLLR